jgi:hypothetical protein
MQASEALTAGDFRRPLGKAVDGRIALRDLHDFLAGIIGVAANARSLSSQGELRVAFGQSLLRERALSDVGIVAEKADRLASRLVAPPSPPNPADLAVGPDDAKFKANVSWRCHRPILQRFDLVIRCTRSRKSASTSHCRPETPDASSCGVKQAARARVPIPDPYAVFNWAKQAVPRFHGPLFRRLALGKHGRQNERESRHNGRQQLRTKRTLYDRKVCIAKMTYAERGCSYRDERYSEGARDCEELIAYRQPQQQRKHDGIGVKGEPGSRRSR